MTLTKTAPGVYTVTGYTQAGGLVQYEITDCCDAWDVTLVSGAGFKFNELFNTKGAAVQAIRENT
jgi:hypothetical protein